MIVGIFDVMLDPTIILTHQTIALRQQQMFQPPGDHSLEEANCHLVIERRVGVFIQWLGVCINFDGYLMKPNDQF